MNEPDQPVPLPDLRFPTLHAPDSRATRATALQTAARIHAGRGTMSHQVIADAEVIAAYLRTGQPPEDPRLVAREEFWRRSIEETGDVPGIGFFDRTEPETDARRRWWQRRR